MKLEQLDTEGLTQLISIVSDIAIVVDAAGMVEDVSLRKNELAALGCQAWIGRPWTSTVTSESVPKAEALFEARTGADELRWRQVNHPTRQGVDMPIQYVAMALGDSGRRLVLGRDMEAIASLQRRLVETQQSMERDYLRLRHVEGRYRVLFETTSEAVLVVDGANMRVVEANVGAMAFSKDPGRKLTGREIGDCFDSDSRDAVHSLLRTALATGRIEMGRARFAGAAEDCTVSATVFRQEGGPHFMLRLTTREAPAQTGAPGQSLLVGEAMEGAPYGVVLTDRNGLVQAANSEFLSMLGATAPSQVLGQALENWLVRGGVDWGVLLTHLRAQSVVKDFATELRSLAGLTLQVEIGARSLTSDASRFALYVRDVSRRQPGESAARAAMSESVAELAHLVGRMPMKHIVGETIDMIERMCIQSAIELTNNNRASAAEMLGLSRQSLYVKLRRFGMINDSENANLG